MATVEAPTNTLHARYDAIFGPEGFLNRNNVERREEIELLGLATISGVDTLFLGDPGVGKTWMIELLVNDCLTDMSLFSHLLAKDMSADEVLGPRDIMAMKESKIRRMTDGFLPESNYAYLDEVFKASPPMLNPLLDIIANRILKMGGEVQDCSQLVAVFMSSNELPDREDLMAFRDRIGITKKVEPVRTAEGRRAVTDLQLDYQASGTDTSGLEPLTLSEIGQVREACRTIVVPDAIRDMMGEAQQKWLEKGHAPSQRRIGQMWRIVKARAWAQGRVEVGSDDLLPCQHMAFNHPTDAASAREVILEFATAFTRKAEELRQALEPILLETDKLREQIDAAQGDETEQDRLMGEGFKFLRNLRKLKSKAEAQIKQGQEQGQDITSLEEVLTEISRAHDWAEGVLTATTGE